MNQTEETKLLEQIEEWNDADEFSRCIEAIEAIPEQERDYLLTVKLSRAYSNLAVLGDHGGPCAWAGDFAPAPAESPLPCHLLA